jgi:glycosyltransferase involved in cell wall biosynthesis
MPPSLIAIIPAYNEDRFIGSVVLKARCHAADVIVVDDGSSDLTADVAQAAGARVVRHARNLGKSAALNSGLDLARAQSPEAVVFLDGDGQHHPADIPRLAAPVLNGEADMVVGSRYLERANAAPRWRQAGQMALTAVTNSLSGKPLTDSQSGFRAFGPRALEQLRFSQSSFTAESEMQFLAREHGWKVLEVPVGMNYAEGPKRNPFIHGMGVVDGILRLAGQTRPLLYFGGLGAFLLVAGLTLGWYVVVLFDARGELAVGYALITVLLAIVGTLSISTGIILHSVRALLLTLIERKPQ